ncbi:unnamed protein product [Polarella glacialis]|uniref:Uncharacterized protein n=1 Tax=Polarella glacialis TaxID=89957 RepID=A0A813GDR1_POLGL|nr:unnamed protein product [Polarella glacialis]
MKAGKPSKMAMTKGGLVETLASETGLKKSERSKIIDAITTVGAESVKRTGKFVLPGLCVSKTRQRAATKAGKRNLFGKTSLGLTMASFSWAEEMPAMGEQRHCLLRGLAFPGHRWLSHRDGQTWGYGASLARPSWPALRVAKL